MSKAEIRALYFVANTNQKSGVATVLMNYYSRLHEKIKCDFLYFEELDPNNYNSKIESFGGKVYKICSPYNIIQFQRELNTFCDNHKDDYDIFHYHTPYLGFLFRKIKKKLNGIVVIAHAHVNKFGESAVSYVRNYAATKFSMGVADYFFACSQEAGVYNFGKRFTSNNGYIMNNAIELKKFTYNSDDRRCLRDELGIGDSYVIGHVGNFTPQKNHEFIISIFHEAIKNQKDFCLVLVGEGYLKQEIYKTANKLGVIDKVIFLGVRQDVNRLLNAFDLFVFPSRFEGLGIALVEAETNGLPCLISDCIPNEAKVINCIEKSLIHDDVNIWANVIKDKPSRIGGAYEYMKNAGFDLDVEAEHLLNKYRYCIEGE